MGKGGDEGRESGLDPGAGWTGGAGDHYPVTLPITGIAVASQILLYFPIGQTGIAWET